MTTFIWSIPDGRAVRDWEPQEVDRGGDLLWTEQGLYVASRGGLSLWEPLTASLIHRFTDDSMLALAVAAESRAAALSEKGDVFVWQLDRDDPPRRLAVPVGKYEREHFFLMESPLALAPDGLAAAVTCGDGIVYAGPVTGGELRAVYTHPQGDEDLEDGSTVVVHYTPAGRLLISGMGTALRDNCWWYTDIVADGLSGEVVWRSPPQLLHATARALSPDGRTLLTGYEDGTLLVWPLGPGNEGE